MNSSSAQFLPHLALPNEIYYKKGSLITLKFISKKGRIIIFSGKNSLKASGLLDKIQTYCRQESIGPKIVSIESEPTIEKIESLSKELLPYSPTLIIACGGGSVLDTAKIIKVLLDNPKLNLFDHIKPHSISPIRKKIRLIAIPTSGSGAEVSWTAPVIDKKNKRKIPLVSSSLIPDLVILDPELTLSLPQNLTGSTALDAFTHALESFCSILNNNFTNQYAIMAGKLIHKFLLKTLEKPDYLEGRENLQFASTFAGFAQNSTSVGAIHAFSHTLGATLNIPHALGNVIFLPTILKLNIKFSSIPLLFLKEVGFKSLTDFLDWLESVKRISSLESNWSKLSKTSNKISTLKLASLVVNDVCMKTNIHQFSLLEVKDILEKTK